MAHSDIFVMLNLITFIFFFFLKVFFFLEFTAVIGVFYFVLEKFFFA